MTVVARQFAADIKPSEAIARPVPLWLPPEYKSADINETKGIITSYLAVYRWPDGTPHVDPYLDTVEPGAFRKTIGDLTKSRDARGYPYLVPFLWQHDRKEILGGVKALSEDSVGVIYESQLNLDVQRAREAFSLARERMIASSYGYDCIRSFQKGDVRHLTELRLVETSLVSFPANELAIIIDTKDSKKKFYVPGNFPEVPAEKQQEKISFPEVEDVSEESMLYIKSVCGNTGLTIGPRDEQWDWSVARAQYRAWGIDAGGNVDQDKWKQVHLLLDGNPFAAESYAYPYCYIVDGQPRICVDAIKNILKQLKSLKSPEVPQMRQKCARILERINVKYARNPLVLETPGKSFVYKQDFATAWTKKLPSQLLQDFFRMSDTLTSVLLENFQDGDVENKTQAIDDCCGQYAENVKEWYPGFASAQSAQEALQEEDQEMPMMPMFGMYGLDMAGLGMKRSLDYLSTEYDLKEGRRLSDTNKKKLRGMIDNINHYLAEITSFIDEDESQPVVEEPKHDITQGLDVLNTLTPVVQGPSTSSSTSSTAPVSFPVMVEDEQEFDITELLRTIQNHVKGGLEA